MEIIVQPGGRSAAQHNGVYRPGGRVCFTPCWRRLTGASNGGAGGTVLLLSLTTTSECVVMAVVVDEFSLHGEIKRKVRVGGAYNT